ncbi:V-type ATPase 116kDa subunit family protein [Cryobacterium sp. PH29-G1]|uniref:V-type ATPase 116kDa subunit family protein n=1 Tax=Cryobacterium sp. PH29-G1 TaxID=3046211 RepID=UPI0024BAAAA0|nr:V-type ATPase 116kDa subunit family protein [Cryobacterium sp. PH29-G1]MDJ0348017.1 V-type ATPase 116kDa subunit family protein [Cryobacterium sp. PH29-G1]
MTRVALVAPIEQRRELLVAIAHNAHVELDLPYSPGDGPDEVDKAVDAAMTSGSTAGWVGWTPAKELPALTEALTSVGAAVVPLGRPRGVQPPTLLTGVGTSRAGVSRTLVDTYGTVPYADVDPSRMAGVAYVVMFGMMFGDLGHGAILVLAGLVLRSGRIKKLASLKKTWLFVAGAGLTSMVFGALYGEAFGPTGLVPVLWLEPMNNPIPLMVTALIFGAVLLAGAYALGTINRVREGGWAYALYASSGAAGAVLFLAIGLLTWGLISNLSPVVLIAVILAATALVFIFIGFFVDAGGGPTGIMQAVIELVDTVIRLGSNVVSFARLAAFGLTHAALLSVVWSATTALWQPDWRALAAILVFVVGNVLTFALEALVAGVQALRLEYYELFSRIFQSEGRPFRPWAPVRSADLHPDSSSERPLP